MNDRPTPEEIFDRASMWDIRDIGPEIILDDLKAVGYVIVHPDDVPADTEQASGSLYANAYGLGWNNCRRRIFGGTP